MSNLLNDPRKVGVFDGLRNALAKIGLLGEKRGASTYSVGDQSIEQYTNMYDASWIARRGINIPAFDAIRAWREWSAPEATVNALVKEENRLKLRSKVYLALIWARIAGGSAIYIGTDHRPDIPLDQIGRKQGVIKFLNPLSLDCLNLGEINQDPIDPQFMEYKTIKLGKERSSEEVHPSRLIIFRGQNFSDCQTRLTSRRTFGESILKDKYEIVRDADAAVANLSALTFEASVDVYGVPDLMENVADAEYQRKLVERFSTANMSKGMNRAIIRDKNEEYDKKELTLRGAAEAAREMVRFASGSFGIPFSRFIGEQVKGLNNTGEADHKNYDEMVNGIQTLDLDFAMQDFTQLLIASATGKEQPNLEYTWRPLNQPTKMEAIESSRVATEVAEKLILNGMYLNSDMAPLLAKELEELEVFQGISKIKAQEIDPMEMKHGPPDPTNEPGSGNPGNN